MRTVTFAAAPVKRLLDNSFVCAVINTTGDPSAGESFSHSPNDPPGPCLRGSGEHNVQILVLTPKGELFQVISGFIGPEDLERELKFALATYQAIKRDSANAKSVVRDQHVRFLKERGFTDEELSRKSTLPFGDFMGFGQGFSEMQNFANGQFNMGSMLDGLTRHRVLADHRFAMEHPLMPIDEFRAEELVGSGASFFGSTSSGMSASSSSGSSGRSKPNRKRSNR